MAVCETAGQGSIPGTTLSQRACAGVAQWNRAGVAKPFAGGSIPPTSTIFVTLVTRGGRLKTIDWCELK